MKTLATLLLAACTLTASAQMTDHGTSENGKPLASPAQSTSVTLGGKSIAIHYNSPSIRGRKIMGDLVPFGQVWRTGANPATKFETTGDFKVGDLKIPAGNYTLYTLPAAPGTPWKFHPEQRNRPVGHRVPRGQRPRPHAHALRQTPRPAGSHDHILRTHDRDDNELHVRWETTDEWVEIKTAK